MKTIIITVVLDDTHFGLFTYSRVSDLRLYTSFDDKHGGELDRRCRFPPSLAGPKRRSGIDDAVRNS